MQIVALSDIHGRSLGELEEQVLRNFDPDNDILLILGDMDTTDSIREVIRFQERYGARVVPGNHEHGLYHDQYFFSSSMTARGHDFPTLRRELKEDQEIWQYVGQLLENQRVDMHLDASRHGEDFHTIALHGALAGSLQSNHYAEGQVAELWYRLLENWDEHGKNFAEMERQGFRVMIRGHDPDPQYLSRDSEKMSIARSGEHELLPDRSHTITVGDYYDGHYVTIDTGVPGKEYPVLKFHTLQE